jgi:hypothetical protein
LIGPFSVSRISSTKTQRNPRLSAIDQHYRVDDQ